MKLMTNEQLTQASMIMISKAGDGREMIQQALSNAENGNITDAIALISSAHDLIKDAHIQQTKVLQKYMEKGDDDAIKLLFSHAQDTLMTINSEYYIAKHMIECIRLLNHRFDKLEAKINEFLK